MASYENMAAMSPNQGYIGGYGPDGGVKGQHIDPNVFRSHPTFQGPSHQVMSYQAMGRPDENEAVAAGPKPVGESASYDNMPTPSETAFDKPAADMGANNIYQASAGGHRKNAGRRNGDGERDILDFFYKKPDPNYVGTYGADYQPQLSKTKIAVAAAALTAVVFGFSKYKSRRRDDQYREYDRYPRSGGERKRRHPHHNHSQSTGPTQYEYDANYDGRRRY